MYRKMLVLLDGSRLAEVVFAYAQELSVRLNLSLDLLHVCTTQEAEQLPMRQAYMDHMAEMLQKKVMSIHSQTGEKPSGQNIQVSGKVLVGYPAEEILKYSDENNVDLIMLSTHGRSGIKVWGLGSVANKVIHASRVPIWLVPAELREEIIYDQLPERPVVIPVDGSRFSEEVIPYVIGIAKQRAAETEIVLVYTREYPLMSISPSQLKHFEDEIVEIQKYLDNLGKKFENTGIRIRSEILSGEVASSIIDYIKNNPAQLIAMATHNQTGLSYMVFSTVTENIINLVRKTPIFLVNPAGSKK